MFYNTTIVTTTNVCLFLTAIMVAAAIGVWGGYIKKEYRYDLMTFYWAFYVAIASAVIAIVAAILFFCEGCRARTYTGYHMTRVV